MRQNGTLSIEWRTGGGLDEFGEPVGDSVIWGEPIACLIRTNSDTRKGKYEDGEFRQASFVVLTEHPINPERVRLERQGEPLGEFRVLSVESVITAGRTMILV